MARADLATAEARIERALVAQPKSSEALLAKSQLLRLKNDAQGAISVLDELIRDRSTSQNADDAAHADGYSPKWTSRARSDLANAPCWLILNNYCRLRQS